MGRKSRQSPFEETLEAIFRTLKIMPVWFGPVFAVIVFVAFRFLCPALMPVKKSGFDFGTILRPLLTPLAWLCAGAVLLAWIAAEIWKRNNRRLLDRQTGLTSIKNISWQEFELLISEAYKRKGYLAEVINRPAGDGGIDIILTGHGETVLVQCKQWKAWKVSVTTVRELLGVVVSENATRGIVVTNGRFTQDALKFARKNPRIELVAAAELLELIRGIQTSPNIPPPPNPIPASPSQPTPLCPQCGFEMVLRTARVGPNPGSQFWGCSKYPTCRGTRQIM